MIFGYSNRIYFLTWDYCKDIITQKEDFKKLKSKRSINHYIRSNWFNRYKRFESLVTICVPRELRGGLEEYDTIGAEKQI